MPTKTRINGENYTQLPRLVSDDIILKGLPQTSGAPAGYGDLAQNVLYPANKSATNLPITLFPKDSSFLTVASGSATLTYGLAPNGKYGIRVQATNFVQLAIPSAAGMRYQGDMYVSFYGTNSLSNLGAVQMRAYFGAGTTNYREGNRFSQSVIPTNSPVEQGGALTYQFNAGNTTTVGTIATPTNFEMSQARIVVQPASGAGSPFDVWIFAVGFGSPRRKGRICVMYDDGWESAYTLGFPVFDALGIPQTMGVIPQAAGLPEYMTLDQLKIWRGAGGSCVAHGPSGGSTNLVALYGSTADWPNNAVADINVSLEYLKDNGLAEAHDNQCYVWPEGQFQRAGNDTSLLQAVSEQTGIVCARTAVVTPTNQRQYIYNQDAVSKYQRLAMPRVGHQWAGSTAAEATNIATITQMIQECALYGLDFYLVFHKVKPTSTPDGSMSSIDIRVSDLQTLADAVKTEIDAGRLEAVHMRDFVATDTVFGSF